MAVFGSIDTLLGEIDTAIRTLFPPQKRGSSRVIPGKQIENIPPLTSAEKKHIAGLMRVNHTGEVCAQALYQGQALTARLPEVRSQMAEAAAEEIDHLAWCEQRLRELNSQPSYLNTFWYISSLMIGAVAGLAGDRWSLGFVAETEKQVSTHLQNHLENISERDLKTKAILESMQADEMRHAETAREAGAADLPGPIKTLMGMASKLMTKTSYYL